MFLLPPLHVGSRDHLGLTHTAPVGAASLVGLPVGSVLSVGRLVVLDSRERDLSRGPHLETECVLTSSRVSVLGVLVVSTLTLRGTRDQLHPDEHIRVLLHLDGKEGRTSVVALLLPEERVVAKVVGALLRTEKRPLTRSQSLVSCS